VTEEKTFEKDHSEDVSKISIGGKELYNLKQGNTKNSLTTTDETEQEDSINEFFTTKKSMQLEKNTDVDYWTDRRVKEFYFYSIYLQAMAMNRMHILSQNQQIEKISTDVNEQENPILQVFY
jgi:hypothetical protein